MIHHTGGLAVLAHPVYIQDEEIIEEILQQGFDGVDHRTLRYLCNFSSNLKGSTESSPRAPF